MAIGLDGSTSVKTTAGYKSIREIRKTDCVLCGDGCYSHVDSLSWGRANTIIRVTIEGLLSPILLTPNQSISIFVEEGLTRGLCASELTLKDRIVCPVIEDPSNCAVWDDLHECTLDFMKVLGAFYVSGVIEGDMILLDQRSMNDSLMYSLEDYLDCLVMDFRGRPFVRVVNERLLSVIQELFGVTGTGPLHPSLYSINKQARMVFLGGAIDALGRAQENGFVSLCLPNKCKTMELMELAWKTDIPACAIPEMPPRTMTPTLLLRPTTGMIEMYGPIITQNNNFPFVKSMGKHQGYVTLGIKGLEVIDWAKRPVYDLSVENSVAGYVAGMISVGPVEDNLCV